jgi:hypothetical protein
LVCAFASRQSNIPIGRAQRACGIYTWKRLSVGGPLWSSGKVSEILLPYPCCSKNAEYFFGRIRQRPDAHIFLCPGFSAVYYVFATRTHARACKESNTGKGPVTIRTPCGLGVEEWEDGLEKYAKSYQALDGIDNYDIKKK